MLRNLFRFIAVMIALAVVRVAVVAIMNFFRQAMGGAPAEAQPASRPADSTAAGPLEKDPVCGTFVSPASSIRMTAGGAVHHFCSTECRDKFQERA